MTRTVDCSFLQEPAEGLDRPPLPGELGQRIFENISKQAWQQWLAHQTMLINEKRLSPIDPEHRKYLFEQAEAFLFGGEVDQADGYVPPSGVG
ncbi:MAG: oxidative damage protection protein [Wenzhouxiangella sp.]|nr:MAG: oxidative damage protection protein [Wenzhouxiangella sp.]